MTVGANEGECLRQLQLNECRTTAEAMRVSCTGRIKRGQSDLEQREESWVGKEEQGKRHSRPPQIGGLNRSQEGPRGDLHPDAAFVGGAWSSQTTPLFLPIKMEHDGGPAWLALTPTMG